MNTLFHILLDIHRSSDYKKSISATFRISNFHVLHLLGLILIIFLYLRVEILQKYTILLITLLVCNEICF